MRSTYFVSHEILANRNKNDKEERKCLLLSSRNKNEEKKKKREQRKESKKVPKFEEDFLFIVSYDP